jgi:hypothetical protein
VVIPAYDEDSLLPTLKSLQACDEPRGKVEVIIVFNASTADEDRIRSKHLHAAREALEWHESLKMPLFEMACIQENKLEVKHAGVGLARKIGMDEAVRHFNALKQEGGIIVCFDADSQCMPNYFKAIEEHFMRHPHSPAASIYFEHPLRTKEFSNEVQTGILHYELHLRYYRQLLKHARLPYAYHTIGSSMVVKASDYCLQGGMNKRKAGEDFYFLQKFIKLGGFTEINTTTVVPSPRPSHRVPFGTGRAIQEMLNKDREIESSYAWESAKLLKQMVETTTTWWRGEEKVNPIWLAFIGRDRFQDKLQELKQNSATESSFYKRLWQWFDAFQCLKFMHFLRDHYFPNQKLIETVPQLLLAQNSKPKTRNSEDLLHQMRKLDRMLNSECSF